MTAVRVLIVGSDLQRGTLAATRSLGRAGHTVLIASTIPGHAARSRYCGGWFETPPAGSRDLLDEVAQIITRERVQVVFAGDDEHLLSLSQHRSVLGEARFPYAPHQSVTRALDKLRLHRLARQCGLQTPDVTIHPPEADADEWVLKPRIYTPGTSHEIVSATDVDDDDDDLDHEFFYQRRVGGPLMAVIALTGRDGELVYAGAQEAHAIFPEPFGVSARARTVPLDPALADGVRELLRALGWWGIAELQFVRTDEGAAQLIDFNGRFFGSLSLTAASGVDLPSAWVETAMGGHPTVGPSRPGTRYQWLEGDLRRAASSGLASEYWTALRHAPVANHGLWSMSDPMPAFRHLAELARRAVKKAGGR